MTRAVIITLTLLASAAVLTARGDATEGQEAPAEFDTASAWYIRHIDPSDTDARSTPAINAALQEAMTPEDTGSLKREEILAFGIPEP